MFFARESISSTSRFSLRTRIRVSILLLIFVIFTGYGIAFWHARMLRNIVLEQNPKLILIFQAADALLTSVSRQRDFVPNYLLDHNPEWILHLDQNVIETVLALQNAEKQARTPQETGQIQNIGAAYFRYTKSIESLIIAYRRGVKSEIYNARTEAAAQLVHAEALAQEFKEMLSAEAGELQASSESEINRIQHFNLTIVFLVTLLLLMLLWRASRHILNPLHELAKENPTPPRTADKEITAVYSRISGLMQNAGETSKELERSKENLEKAERMVVVARLAASMAHSIRNPLTSVKMRLFSLNRSLVLDHDQQEDFDVISDEIRHLDIIVQNFLEFSRPPKLKVQSISPSEIIDRTLVLLNHRFEAYDVTVTLHRRGLLPNISGDPEQLKEVFVNMLENACQAMAGTAGRIDIFEETSGPNEDHGLMTQIRISDSGPGIPKDFLPNVFEPFYTTKGEGTGLGLSIAYRIVENHGGRIDVHSTSEGTCFTVSIPAIFNPEIEGNS